MYLGKWPQVMTYLFVDTNVLLHYRRLEEIDWLNLSKSKEVVVILCPVIIRELDQHKDSHPQNKIRKRAQEIIASLHSKLSGEESDVIRNGVRLEFIAEDPSIDFSKYRLRSEITDDWLIASVIEFKQRNPNDEIKIVSADLGLSIKSKAQNIKVLRPSETDRLAKELDVDEKRIRDLQKELAEVKNSIPELKLCFWKSEKQNVFQIQLQQPIPFSEDEANVEMNRIRVEHPHFLISSKPKKIGEGLSMQELLRSGVSQSQADNYNAELNSFYQDYDEYLRQRHEFENAMRRSITLEIGLENSGTVPADDIDVHLHFPDGFSLFDADEDLPQKPKPPEPPAELGTIGNLRLTVPSFQNLDYTKALRLPSDISSPQIERTNSYDVRSQIKKAKHGYSLRIAKFLVQFDSYESAASFQIDYSISAANLPKAAYGHLSVVIERPS